NLQQGNAIPEAAPDRLCQRLRDGLERPPACRCSADRVRQPRETRRPDRPGQQVRVVGPRPVEGQARRVAGRTGPRRPGFRAPGRSVALTEMGETGHVPVLSREVLVALNLPGDGFLVDATFGRGGHSRLCLGQLGPRGRILAIDRDPDAVAYGRRIFAGEPRITVVQGRFSELAALVARHAPDARVDAVLLDLGVSSPQLDTPARGFSFSAEGPLDMRMDPGAG